MKRSLMCFFAVCTCMLCSAQMRPYNACRRCFPYQVNVKYHEAKNPDLTTITTSNLRERFHDWKKKYLVHKKDGTAYIKNDEQWVGENGKTTSEANGYGMVIEALMAGCEPNSQQNFDALYSYARKHHIASANPDNGYTSPYLMSWKQYEIKPDEKDAAVDGDLDIAYALLLGAAQWGESGKYHYRDCANKTLKAILDYETDRANMKFERGSDNHLDSAKDAYHFFRTSDFMPVNIRAFASCTQDSIYWRAFLKANYSRFKRIQSQKYGLFPDYVYEYKPGVDSLITKTTAHLADGQKLDDGGSAENPFGANAGFNACRVPWRIGLDYLLTGSEDAKEIIDKLNAGIRRYTLDTACLLSNVMLLSDGLDTAAHHHYVDSAAMSQSADISTIGPLCVAAMANNDLAWRSQLFQLMTDNQQTMCFNADPKKLGKHRYYDNTIRIICEIILTHNYWTPDLASVNIP